MTNDSPVEQLLADAGFNPDLPLVLLAIQPGHPCKDCGDHDSTRTALMVDPDAYRDVNTLAAILDAEATKIRNTSGEINYRNAVARGEAPA